MGSSIFNFKTMRHRRYFVTSAIFLITFMVLLAGGLFVDRAYDLKLTGRAAQALPPDVASWSWSGAYLPCSQDALDYFSFYYNIGDSIYYAKRATILLLGSSRIQYAFPVEALAHYETQTQNKIFNLGFGYSEGAPFALEIIEANNLYPKLAVVNVDGFFTSQPSYFVPQVKATGKLKAAEKIFECAVSFKVAQALGPYIPSFVAGRHDKYILRNTIYGSWFPANWSADQKMEIHPPPPAQTNIADAVALSKKFKAEMESRGAQLVFTWIPTNLPTNSRQQAAQIAAAAGVPFISPQLEGLTSTDGSHLSFQSALRFSDALLRELNPYLK